MKVKMLFCAEIQPPNSVPIGTSICGSESAYLIETELPSANTFDIQQAASFFGFGFGIVVFFWLLGLKSSLLLKPFWR